eukprot:3760949-Rhodomonas_salina.3
MAPTACHCASGCKGAAYAWGEGRVPWYPGSSIRHPQLVVLPGYGNLARDLACHRGASLRLVDSTSRTLPHLGKPEFRVRVLKIRLGSK